jgi:hypothetical protein
MNHRDFNVVFKTQMQRCEEVLGLKSAEYATTADKLHNFKVAAYLQGLTIDQALGGMMAKHSVSIYDLIGKNEPSSMELWDEKITDHINYLILLKAILVEAEQEREAK